MPLKAILALVTPYNAFLWFLDTWSELLCSMVLPPEPQPIFPPEPAVLGYYTPVCVVLHWLECPRALGQCVPS